MEEFKFIQPGKIRVRIAPSPTGFLHLGTARTALFNYLFAKKNQGSFILRIEDTDIQRSDPLFEKDILESLRWLGIEWDEGPDKEGEFGPCRQSQRLQIYAKYLEKLLTEDKAYYCFCSEEELEIQRQYQMSRGEAPRYSGKCSQLSKKDVEKRLAKGLPSIIRFRVPAKKVEFDDLIRGKLEFDSSLIGDIALAKDLSTPLYNFAVVVDDFEMKISHVLRGEDHISNTPKQILIQEALGFLRPEYGHFPMILGPDRTKLSKRHGATAISDYKKAGYLAETLVNFMAFLGWNPGGEREIYSLPSLIKEFSLEKVQKGGAIFNFQRLDFLNGFYIRQKSSEKLTELCLPYLIESGFIEEIKNNSGNSKKLKGLRLVKKKFKIKETGEIIDQLYLEKIITIYQERLKKLSEITELTDFFFKKSLNYDIELLRWKEMTDEDIIFFLDKIENILSKIEEADFSKDVLEKTFLTEAEKLNSKTGDRGYLLWPLRAAFTGKKSSAGPFQVAEILGREKCLERIRQAKKLFF